MPTYSPLLSHHPSLMHRLPQLSIFINLSLLDLPIVALTLPLLVLLPLRNDPVDLITDIFGWYFGLGRWVQGIVLFIGQIAPFVFGEVGLGFLGNCESESCRVGGESITLALLSLLWDFGSRFTVFWCGRSRLLVWGREKVLGFGRCGDCSRICTVCRLLLLL